MNTGHSSEVHQIYERLLADASLHGRLVEVDEGQQVHIVETGAGPPLLLIHGTGNSALFLLPLLERLEGIRAVAVDRPGWGLSDPADLPRDRYREAVVAWMDQLLNKLGLDGVALLGNSMGGLWAIWYALAHPNRARCVILLGGTPALPATRSPLPFRLMATPLLGELLQSRPSGPDEVLQFARFVGEEETLASYPHLIDLLVTLDGDPVAAKTLLNETRTILSPFALISPSGWRRQMRVQPPELKQLSVPALVLWGEDEPVGDVSVAREVTDLIPDGRLEMLPAGHGPWLGHPERTAELVREFVRRMEA